MQQTAKHARSKRPGLIRRLLGSKGGTDSSRPEPPSSDLLDLTDPGAMIALARIERLEEGLQLMAETMKVTYGRLTAEVEDVRRQAVRAGSTEEVRRMLARTVGRRYGVKPSATDLPVVPVVPREPERPDEDPDVLTALRRARFAEPGVGS